MKRYIRFSETSGNSYADAYYEIMNLLDDIALSGRFPTKSEKQRLYRLLVSADNATIEDIADANDCYNEHGELCSTWEEMVSALHIQFEHGERIPINSSTHINASEAYINRGQFAPISDDIIYSDISWIAGEIAKQLDHWTKVFGHDCYTVESAIEAFVMMNDDYADWWARGCSSPEAEDRFVQVLTEAMRSQGIELVDDRR